MTLVEILVVISIIHMLTAIMLPAIRGVKERRKIIEAQSTVSAIAVALENYYNEYHSLPPYDDIHTPYPDAPLNAPQLKGLQMILSGEDVTVNDVTVAGGNPKKKQFLQVSPKLLKPVNPTAATDCGYNVTNFPSATTNLVDPWGVSINVKFDHDGDAQIAIPFIGASPTIQAEYAVWSLGPDKKYKLNMATNLFNTDNITSWRLTY